MTRDDLRADVGQLLWVGFPGAEPIESVRRQIADGPVGAAVLFKRNLRLGREPMAGHGGPAERPSLAEQAGRGRLRGERVPEATVSREVADLEALVELTGALHDAVPRGATPLLVAVDQEGGRVQRVRAPATVWPPMIQLDAIDGDAALRLAERTGRALGDELAALGFDLDFAPVLDVHTNPANPVIGDRAFGTTAGRAAERALAFARGLEAAGVLSCGKHFPGHGDTSTDSHLELPRLDHDLERLRRIELAPFRRAVRAGVPMLMTAHVVFAALDADRPATLSRRVITDLLRNELGFEGVVVSDDLDMRAIVDHFGVGDAAVQAVTAGCDALLLCCNLEHQALAREALLRAADGDSSVRARIGEAAGRVRALKRRHFEGARSRPARSAVGRAEHLRLAEHLAGLTA